MAQNKAIRPNCFIEFRVNDPERYDLLERFFNPLRDYTNTLALSINPPDADDVTATGRGRLLAFEETQETGRLITQDETVAHKQFARPEEWLLALRPQDMEMLRMPSHRDSILALRDWHGISRRERRKAIKSSENKRQLRGLADFVDMLKYWQDIEFELVELDRTDPDRARIRYLAFDYPYKGKAALEELLMFFGFLSILKESC